jgi:peptidoglycan/LPS O-acetylase OafA/YrhL
MDHPGLPARLDLLDRLRGVAILGVFAFHALGAAYGAYEVPWRDGSPDWTGPGGGFAVLLPLLWGNYGVSLFFVVSGFSIHWGYLRKPAAFATGSFLWRRFWRIYPPYLAALLVLSWRVPFGSWQFVSHALLLHDFTSATFFGINGSFWSLAVEVQLYLLYPLLLAARQKFGLGRVMAALFVLSVVVRAVAIGTGMKAVVAYSPAALWFDWALGAWLAERFAAGRPPVRFAAPVLALTGVVAAALMLTPYWKAGFGAASLFWAVALDQWLRRPAADAGRVGRWLALIGVWSYSFYLWHQPVLSALAHRLPLPPFLTTFVLLASLPAFLAGAGLAYRLTEQPSMWLGRRLSELSGVEVRARLGALVGRCLRWVLANARLGRSVLR